MENNQTQFSDVVRKIGSSLVVFLGVLTILFGVKIVSELKTMDDAEFNTISVSGDGEVLAKPDTGEITFSVRNDAKTMADAQKVVSDKIAQALKLMKDNGIDEKHLKTEGYYSNPKYEYPKYEVTCMAIGCPTPSTNPKIVGYEVSQNIKVTVKDLDKISPLIEGLAKIGVTDLSGPNFTIGDTDELSEQARALAIADAKANAEKLAKELGVRLVEIVSYSDESGGMPYPMYYAKAEMAMDSMAGAAAPSLPTGENKITSRVTITYKIK